MWFKIAKYDLQQLNAKKKKKENKLVYWKLEDFYSNSFDFKLTFNNI